MRKCLSPLKRGIKKYDFIGFDCETYGNKNKFLFAGVYDEKYNFFKNENQAISFLEKLRLNTHIVATNLSFDFNSLFHKSENFLNYEIIMKNGNYILCKKDNISFIDTLSISPFSVKKLGNLLKLDKFYYKNLGKIPKNKYEWNNIKRYNSRDCLISKQFMEYWQESLNILGGEFKLTIASCAMDLFRRKFLKFPIWHEKEDINEFIFKSYYGGRVEAFKRGKIKNYNYYDFNSLYPSVMCNKFPLPSSMEKINPDSILYCINKYEGISEVTIKSPDKMKYPLLPFRTKTKLIFPLGIFKGTYTNIELRKALSLGYEILKCHKGVIYRNTFYPFKSYVKTLYSLRIKYKTEKNDIMQYACKMLLNSLYGKFGSRHFDKINFYLKNGFKRNYFELSENLGYEITKIKADRNYIIPIFATYVTAYGRIKLYDMLVSLNGIYCDTDSIITKDIIPDSKKLGEMKLEKKIKTGYIIKPKMYLTDTEVKVKGLRSASIEDFMSIIEGKKVAKQKFIKIKEALIHNFTVNEIKMITKEMGIEDNKRNWKYKFNSNMLQKSTPLYIFAP